MDLLVATHNESLIATMSLPPESAIGRTAEDLLRRSGYTALGDVSCVALGDELHLRGRVRSYYLKQVAQEIAASVPVARRVINWIEVTAPARRMPVGHD